ncbi:MAG: hypothetical protein ACI835_004193 [Planctomycetota bacterium]|jgi:hypothetical protein
MYSTCVAGELQDNASSQRDRRWPRRTTIAFASVLLFWAIFSYVHNLSRLAVEPDSGPVPAYSSIGKWMHEVAVSSPIGPPAIVVGMNSDTGETVTASCTTCHATRPPDAANSLSQDLDTFHLGLTFAHGNGTLSCLSCHNPLDYDLLRAANGKSIAFADVMSLCAQCHNKQSNEYLHGAHGGMRGYWDLSQGGRTRHNCIDCHDPHAPAYPRMQPTFKPLDRGLTLTPAVAHELKASVHHE